MNKFYCYERCTTCKKAQKYLDEHKIPYEYMDIKTAVLTSDLMKEYHGKSKKELKKLFNTSGNLYKEMHLKDKIGHMTEDEIYALLSTDGMLVKRPILVTENKVYFGFKEEEYEELLK